MLKQRILIALAVLMAASCAFLAFWLKPQDKPRQSFAKQQSMFDGIPQKGSSLGLDSAPVRVAIYVDPQCPACRRFEQNELPEVVRRFVRTGKAQLQLRPVAIVGEQGQPAVEYAYAAGAQSRMWQFFSALFFRQQAKNSGYLTPAFLAKTAALSGLNLAGLRRDLPKAKQQSILARRQATKASVKSTPSFELDGGRLIAPKSLGSGYLTSLIEGALK